jgi:hypothetical protein
MRRPRPRLLQETFRLGRGAQAAHAHSQGEGGEAFAACATDVVGTWLLKGVRPQLHSDGTPWSRSRIVICALRAQTEIRRPPRARSSPPDSGEAQVHGGRDRDGAAADRGVDRKWQADTAGVPGAWIHRADLLPVAQGVGGRKLEQAKRLKELEKDSSRLKRLVAKL